MISQEGAPPEMIEQLEGKALEWYDPFMNFGKGETGFVRIDDLGKSEDDEVSVTFHEVVKVREEKITRKRLQEILDMSIRTGVIWKQLDATWYDWGEPAPTSLD